MHLQHVDLIVGVAVVAGVALRHNAINEDSGVSGPTSGTFPHDPRGGDTGRAAWGVAASVRLKTAGRARRRGLRPS